MYHVLAGVSRWINSWLQPLPHAQRTCTMRYSPEAYQVIISTSILVTIPVCMFLFIVGICLTNLLIAQLLVSMLHDDYVERVGLRNAFDRCLLYRGWWTHLKSWSLSWGWFTLLFKVEPTTVLKKYEEGNLPFAYAFPNGIKIHV